MIWLKSTSQLLNIPYTTTCNLATLNVSSLEISYIFHNTCERCTRQDPLLKCSAVLLFGKLLNGVDLISSKIILQAMLKMDQSKSGGQPGERQP